MANAGMELDILLQFQLIAIFQACG